MCLTRELEMLRYACDAVIPQKACVVLSLHKEAQDALVCLLLKFVTAGLGLLIIRVPDKKA